MLGKDVSDLDVKEIGFREFVMFVDFDQEKNEWIVGRVRFASSEIEGMIQDIESAIELFRKTQGMRDR